MKIFVKLVLAIVKNVEITKGEKKRSKIFYNVMAFVAIFGIMIPICVLVGLITYSLTKGFLEIGEGKNGIMLFMHLISIFSFIFGLNVIFNVFYFSEDVETLLPLPLRPYQIIASRFTAALISESYMQVLIVIAALAGYIIAAELPWYSWLTALLAVITAPILPLVYCAVLCMILMAFTRWIHNKDVVNRIMGVFIVVLIAGIVSCAGFVYNMDMQSLINVLASEDSAVLNVTNGVFPHTQFVVSALETGNMLDLLIYLGIHVLAIAVFMILAQLLYFKGVLNINQIKQVRDDSAVQAYFKKHKQSSPEFAYFKKEMRILFRTPAYFMNCVLIGIVWPIFIYLIYLLQGPTRFLERFIDGLHGGNAESTLYYILAVSCISVLVTAANSIASSSLSREGSHFSFIKYIPMSYVTQLKVKAEVAIVLSGGSMLLYILIAGFLLGVNVILTLFACLVGILSVCFTVSLGVYMDSVNPKLIWEDELNALRGNFNIFFNMAIAMIIEAVLCVGGVCLYHAGFSMPWVSMGLVLILLVLNIFGFYLCRHKAVKNIENIQF